MQYGLMFSQQWSMFSPYPSMKDGWHIIYGERANGDKVDLWGTDFTKKHIKPKNIAAPTEINGGENI